MDLNGQRSDRIGAKIVPWQGSRRLGGKHGRCWHNAEGGGQLQASAGQVPLYKWGGLGRQCSLRKCVRKQSRVRR